MKRRERNLLILLGIVIIASLPFMPFWGSGQQTTARQRGGSDQGEGGSPKPGIANAESFPRLDKELLAQEPAKFEGALRNLFTFSETRGKQATVSESDDEYSDSSDDSETASSTENTQGASVAEPAKQQLTDYEYLGFIERDGTRHAAFFWRGRYFTGIAGDTINETFEIKSIEQDFVLIYVIGGDFEQKLKLNPPAGNQEEGEDS
jgi:hypothetical protein